MKKILLFVMILFATVSCTKYNTIDTGLAKGRFDGNMFQCMLGNEYDWSLTCEMITRGGLKDLFEGKRAGFEKITFFGPTNHSIRVWLLDNKYYTETDGKKKVDVSMVPAEKCEELILRHIVKGQYMRNDIPRGVHSDPIGTKGIVLETAVVTKDKLWVYSVQGSYHDIPDVGPVTLHLKSFTRLAQVNVASADIEPDNGVIHSLSYSYAFGKEL